MILYQCESMYQLMSCILHKINYRYDNKAILVTRKRCLLDFPSKEGLYSFFDDVFVFPTFPTPRPLHEESLMREGKKYFSEINGTPLEKFDEIFCACHQSEFTFFLAFKGIHYNYIEDSKGHFRIGLKFLMNVIKEKDYHRWVILDKLKTLTGECECIDKIYARYPNEKFEEDPRFVEFDIDQEIRRLDEDKYALVYDYFGIKKTDVNDNKSILLLTGFESRLGYISYKEQLKMYALIVDYFVPNKKVYIKSHPQDLCGYKRIFYDADILKRTYPIELLANGKNSENMLMVTCDSMARYSFRNVVYLEKPPYLCREWLYKLHEYNAMRIIYGEAALNGKWLFYSPNDKTGFFICWKIDVIRDISILDEKSCIFFPVIDDKENLSVLREVMRRTKYCVAFINMREDMLEIIKPNISLLAVKKIIVNTIGENRVSYVYLMTSDMIIKEKIKKLEYKVDLKYMRGCMEMKKLTEQEEEIIILKGILDATEKRLLKIMEENEELKAQLDNGDYHQNKHI